MTYLNDDCWWNDEWPKLFDMVACTPFVCKASEDTSEREYKLACIAAAIAEAANDSRHEVVRLRNELANVLEQLDQVRRYAGLKQES